MDNISLLCKVKQKEVFVPSVKELYNEVQILFNEGSEIWKLKWMEMMTDFMDPSKTINTAELNKVLKVVEYAFKSPETVKRVGAYECWNHLIQLTAQRTDESMKKKVFKTIMVPIFAHNHSNIKVMEAKLQTWELLIELGVILTPYYAKLCWHRLLKFLYCGMDTDGETLGASPSRNYYPVALHVQFVERAAKCYLSILKEMRTDYRGYDLVWAFYIKDVVRCSLQSDRGMDAVVDIWTEVIEIGMDNEWPDTILEKLFGSLRIIASNKIERNNEKKYLPILIAFVEILHTIPPKDYCNEIDTLAKLSVGPYEANTKLLTRLAIRSQNGSSFYDAILTFLETMVTKETHNMTSTWCAVAKSYASWLSSEESDLNLETTPGNLLSFPLNKLLDYTIFAAIWSDCFRCILNYESPIKNFDRAKLDFAKDLISKNFSPKKLTFDRIEGCCDIIRAVISSKAISNSLETTDGLIELWIHKLEVVLIQNRSNEDFVNIVEKSFLPLVNFHKEVYPECRIRMIIDKTYLDQCARAIVKSENAEKKENASPNSPEDSPKDSFASSKMVYISEKDALSETSEISRQPSENSTKHNFLTLSRKVNKLSLNDTEKNRSTKSIVFPLSVKKIDQGDDVEFVPVPAKRNSTNQPLTRSQRNAKKCRSYIPAMYQDLSQQSETFSSGSGDSTLQTPIVDFKSNLLNISEDAQEPFEFRRSSRIENATPRKEEASRDNSSSQELRKIDGSHAASSVNDAPVKSIPLVMDATFSKIEASRKNQSSGENTTLFENAALGEEIPLVENEAFPKVGRMRENVAPGENVTLCEDAVPLENSTPIANIAHQNIAGSCDNQVSREIKLSRENATSCENFDKNEHSKISIDACAAKETSFTENTNDIIDTIKPRQRKFKVMKRIPVRSAKLTALIKPPLIDQPVTFITDDTVKCGGRKFKVIKRISAINTDLIAPLKSPQIDQFVIRNQSEKTITSLDSTHPEIGGEGFAKTILVENDNKNFEISSNDEKHVNGDVEISDPKNNTNDSASPAVNKRKRCVPLKKDMISKKRKKLRKRFSIFSDNKNGEEISPRKKIDFSVSSPYIESVVVSDSDDETVINIEDINKTKNGYAGNIPEDNVLRTFEIPQKILPKCLAGGVVSICDVRGNDLSESNFEINGFQNVPLKVRIQKLPTIVDIINTLNASKKNVLAVKSSPSDSSTFDTKIENYSKADIDNSQPIKRKIPSSSPIQNLRSTHLVALARSDTSPIPKFAKLSESLEGFAVTAKKASDIWSRNNMFPVSPTKGRRKSSRCPRLTRFFDPDNPEVMIPGEQHVVRTPDVCSSPSILKKVNKNPDGTPKSSKSVCFSDKLERIREFKKNIEPNIVVVGNLDEPVAENNHREDDVSFPEQNSADSVKNVADEKIILKNENEGDNEDKYEIILEKNLTESWNNSLDGPNNPRRVGPKSRRSVCRQLIIEESYRNDNKNNDRVKREMNETFELKENRPKNADSVRKTVENEKTNEETASILRGNSNDNARENHITRVNNVNDERDIVNKENNAGNGDNNAGHRDDSDFVSNLVVENWMDTTVNVKKNDYVNNEEIEKVNIAKDDVNIGTTSVNSANEVTGSEIATPNSEKVIINSRIDTIKNTKDEVNGKICAASSVKDVVNDMIVTVNSGKSVNNEFASVRSVKDVVKSEIATVANTKDVVKSEIATVANTKHVVKSEIATVANTKDVVSNEIATVDTAKDIFNDRIASEIVNEATTTKKDVFSKKFEEIFSQMIPNMEATDTGSFNEVTRLSDHILKLLKIAYNVGKVDPATTRIDILQAAASLADFID